MTDDPRIPHLRLVPPPARPASGRPVPEDYGLTLDDLNIPYAPGRVGVVLAVLITLASAVAEAWWDLRGGRALAAAGSLLYGGMLGAFGGLGAFVLVHWADPLIGRMWPVYGRLRRYREALADARRASGDEGA
ncbi:hypothetical protein [Azospirillum halopraeferens]|uniref:hypothetical protein n=1 Tax=Azospirillum halopraeferens TaxID=34010 RepID=UPI00040BC88D|nr:hypothetical protein [Azospirillum halopraeferens]